MKQGDKKTEYIKGVIRPSITKAYEDAKNNEKYKKQLTEEKDLYCLVCFIKISEQTQNGIAEYIVTTNEMTELYSIIPNDTNWIQSAKVNLTQLSEKHHEDMILGLLTFTAAMPLDILSIFWEGGKNIFNFIIDGTKSLFKNSVIAKWIAGKYKSKIDYTAQSKKIINAFINFTKNKKAQFKQAPAELQKKVLVVIGDEKGKSVNGLINYKKLLDEGKEITAQQFKTLDELAKEFQNTLKISLAINELNDNPSILNNMSDKEKDAAWKRQHNDKNFQNACKSLGFKDKKRQKGFAALIERMLDGILNFFGGDDDEPTQANDSAIATAMPFVKDAIKAIPPGKYPVYFGNNVSQAQMEKKFQELIK